MKNIKTIMIIAACLLLSIFSLYFQFVSPKRSESKENIHPIEEQEEKESENEHKKEPEENPEEERYGQTYEWSVYFTHMDKIMEDDSFLPYQAYADLVQVTENFLAEQQEFVLENGTDYELQLNPEMTYKKGNLISFHCGFKDPDLADGRELEYVYDDIAMDYTEIRWTEKGEWKITWRN